MLAVKQNQVEIMQRLYVKCTNQFNDPVHLAFSTMRFASSSLASLFIASVLCWNTLKASWYSCFVATKHVLESPPRIPFIYEGSSFSTEKITNHLMSDFYFCCVNRFPLRTNFVLHIHIRSKADNTDILLDFV